MHKMYKQGALIGQEQSNISFQELSLKPTLIKKDFLPVQHLLNDINNLNTRS